jgi:hypothetical protein
VWPTDVASRGRVRRPTGMFRPGASGGFVVDQCGGERVVGDARSD